jgi:hypothetical protein
MPGGSPLRVPSCTGCPRSRPASSSRPPRRGCRSRAAGFLASSSLSPEANRDSSYGSGRLRRSVTPSGCGFRRSRTHAPIRGSRDLTWTFCCNCGRTRSRQAPTRPSCCRQQAMCSKVPPPASCGGAAAPSAHRHRTPRSCPASPAVLLADAAVAGTPVAFESRTPAELAGLEVWAVNALHGIRPVTGWVGAPINAGSAKQWAALKRGRC